MSSKDQSSVFIREILIEEADLFDQEKMIQKLDSLIMAWGKELLEKRYIENIPETHEAWLKTLDMEIYWQDIKDQWDCYVVSCLIFFVLLRDDIKRDFLLQPDNIRGQRLQRWLGRMRHYATPLSKDVVTHFCLSYSMILERKPIKIRYKEYRH